MTKAISSIKFCKSVYQKWKLFFFLLIHVLLVRGICETVVVGNSSVHRKPHDVRWSGRACLATEPRVWCVFPSAKNLVQSTHVKLELVVGFEGKAHQEISVYANLLCMHFRPSVQLQIVNRTLERYWYHRFMSDRNNVIQVDHVEHVFVAKYHVLILVCSL